MKCFLLSTESQALWLVCEVMNQNLEVPILFHMPVSSADVIHGDLLLGLISTGWKANFRSALGVGTQTSVLKLL